MVRWWKIRTLDGSLTNREKMIKENMERLQKRREEMRANKGTITIETLVPVGDPKFGIYTVERVKYRKDPS